MRPMLIYGVLLALSSAPAGTAYAASIQKDCATKYQAAKASNTLNGMNYREFYKQCAAQERAAPAATAATTPPAATAAPVGAPATGAAPTTTAASAPVGAPAAAGTPVFPNAISPQYKSLSAGTARRKTCDDQYKINKANNGNGGLRWTEKGGGYYSECNKHLKG